MTPDPEELEFDETDGEEPAGSAEEVEDLDLLRAKAAESDQYLDRLQRTKAEFENYMKRTGREKTDLRKFVTRDVILAMLPALDNLERAVAAAPERSDDPLLAGVRMTIVQMHKTLESLGVRPVETKNARFDPTQMEAVLKTETDEADENTVLDVYEKGYRLDDFVIRPARVSVAGAKKAKSDED